MSGSSTESLSEAELRRQRPNEAKVVEGQAEPRLSEIIRAVLCAVEAWRGGPNRSPGCRRRRLARPRILLKTLGLPASHGGQPEQ